MYGECTIEAYSQSLVILKRMFEWCSTVGCLVGTVCSQECRENFVKFSKDRLAACVTEKKSVGEKDHPSELSDGRRPLAKEGQMSLSCGSTDSRSWA